MGQNLTKIDLGVPFLGVLLPLDAVGGRRLHIVPETIGKEFVQLFRSPQLDRFKRDILRLVKIFALVDRIRKNGFA